MSFGWSAGDIAQAVALIVKVAKALDSADGSAGDYREAVAFLQSLKHTLEPLQTLTALGAYPAYKDEIRKHVESIRRPIESFLAIATKFDFSLGSNAKTGHHRHITRKLQWRFIESKEVDKLKGLIDGHMKVLDTLLQRLTLDIVWTVHSNLRGEIRTAFADVFDPQLIGMLRGQLQPMQHGIVEVLREQENHTRAIISEAQLCRGELQELRDDTSASRQISDQQVQAIMSKLDGQDVNLKAVSDAIKQYILDNVGKNNFQTQLVLPAGPQDIPRLHQQIDALTSTDSQPEVVKKRMSRESLKEAYYLVLLSFAQFLRNIFLYLSTMTHPSRALMPTLLAKYNISFYDAIGRPPRILDYSCFVSYKVFQAFLQDSFAERPGASWVDRGLYRLSNARSGQAITRYTWSKMVSPGSHIHMFMFIADSIRNKRNDDERCPAGHCNGVLQGGEKFSMRKCSECEMEVLNFQIESLAPSVPDASHLPDDPAIEIAESEALEEKNLGEVDLSDIVHFRRVIRRRRPQGMSVRPGSPLITKGVSPSPAAESQTDSTSGSSASDLVEIFKSFRVGMKDSTAKILPAALKKYNITAPSQDYALYIVYGNRERCLGLEEKPLIMFKELDKAGLKPKFLLRKSATSGTMNTNSSVPHETTQDPSFLESPPDIPESPPDVLGKAPAGVEVFKSFRVNMDDPCSKVLPAALQKYHITAPWQLYDLYIVYGDVERCLGLEERPLILFKQLDKEGRKPTFMLRKKKEYSVRANNQDQ